MLAFKRLIFSLLLFVLVIGLLGYSFHKYYYPHGMRAGKLSTFLPLLETYALDHGGRYPNGGATPLESLQKLYPQYAGEALAGLSGNEAVALARLESGQSLDTNLSSWVYWPGFFASDDPSIALIWEREPGIFLNGRRGSGHAVGFVGGGYDQIPEGRWPQFLQQQVELRNRVLMARTNTTVRP